MEVIKMKRSKNNLTDKEMELVGLLTQDCQSTGDIQSKLKGTTQGIPATDITIRPSSAIMVRVKLLYHATETESLIRKYLKRDRPGRMR